MVQVLQQSPGLGDLLGMGVGQGLQQGVQQQMEQAIKQQQFSKLSKALGLGSPSMQPTSEQQAPSQPQDQQTIQDSTSKIKQIATNPQALLAIDAMDPTGKLSTHIQTQYGNILKQEKMQQQASQFKETQEFKREQSQKNMSFEEKKFSHSETKKYAENLENETKEAKEILHGIDYLDKAMVNKTPNKARDLTYTYLKSKHSPFAALYQSEDAMATELAAKSFAGGFRSLMGSKPTQSEFFWFENILPGILKNSAANLESRNYFKDGADLKIKAQDVYDDIVKKNNGWRPIDIDAQVREKMKPEINKYISNGESLYKKSLENKEKYSIGKTFNSLPKEAPEGTFIKDDKGKYYKYMNGKWVAI